MTQDRVGGESNQGQGKIEGQVGKFVGSRSTEWTAKLNQVNRKVQERIGEVKDTRRFADGRTR